MAILTCDTIVAVLGPVVVVECLLSSELIHFTYGLMEDREMDSTLYIYTVWVIPSIAKHHMCCYNGSNKNVP